MFSQSVCLGIAFYRDSEVEKAILLNPTAPKINVLVLQMEIVKLFLLCFHFLFLLFPLKIRYNL